NALSKIYIGLAGVSIDHVTLVRDFTCHQLLLILHSDAEHHWAINQVKITIISVVIDQLQRFFFREMIVLNFTVLAFSEQIFKLYFFFEHYHHSSSLLSLNFFNL